MALLKIYMKIRLKSISFIQFFEFILNNILNNPRGYLHPLAISGNAVRQPIFLYNKKSIDMNSQSSLDNFDQLAVLGKGSYAKVVLVRRKDDPNKTYAMKILKKKYI